jgi:guanylate cyclase soluble subunit beta
MFGGYWVHKVATRDFRSLMEATGSTTVQFLRNLNALHDRISTTFLDYVPPEFQVEETDSTARYRIHYLSTREGMVPFVSGLLSALAEHFGDTMTIESDEALPATAGTHHVFLVQFH